MNRYIATKPEIYIGRESNRQLYLHQKIRCVDLEQEWNLSNEKSIGLLGYACDAGVKRNQGRKGAAKGPNAIRKVLGKMPNHLAENVVFSDFGTIKGPADEMENAQALLASKTSHLLQMNVFPILLGGSHDIAYGHYNGLKTPMGSDKTIGIINFDAHFDLRSNESGNNSGTPFYQIAQDCQTEGKPFHYLALGIRQDANDKLLFETASTLGVDYVENRNFDLSHFTTVENALDKFIERVDHIYVTIDLDGFSSAYSPGVSAPSPMGFSPDIVLKCLEKIITSKKLQSLDLAEMNPKYDIDNQTAKLAASLIHFVIHSI
ncbi:formimidoylglutamase [Aggregatimonas sangjinii]|uniref:Formimidoylglutamase n=1 Tax=Aggregatimonas sangjinii TaxID=2583587 RepID=A0A5B7SRY3_9FLAO|nr:formimidoylglutamase [Aggregatimonas sangjinii]QCX01317.1 formimidoylglutamase [Aggregatimonas sangjinii]